LLAVGALALVELAVLIAQPPIGTPCRLPDITVCWRSYPC
jgi:hypothetical protein